MQDVHWPESLFGYFPCYSLGAMYAAQWFAAMRRAMPDLDERIGRGELTRRSSTGCATTSGARRSRWTTDELARARQRRGAEPGALQGAPGGALPGLTPASGAAGYAGSACSRSFEHLVQPPQRARHAAAQARRCAEQRARRCRRARRRPAPGRGARSARLQQRRGANAGRRACAGRHVRPAGAAANSRRCWPGTSPGRGGRARRAGRRCPGGWCRSPSCRVPAASGSACGRSGSAPPAGRRRSGAE